MYSGSVQQLWRYPVKSMAGERLRSMRVDGRGAGGDRTHAVLHHHKGAWKPLTAREAPRMLAFAAAYPGTPDDALDPDDPPLAEVVGPGGERFTWPDGGLRGHLVEALGREVELHRDVEGIQDLRRTLLLTTEATYRALAAELDQPLDLRRFRTNVHLDLDAPAWAENGWEGARVEFEGGVVLELLHPCVRCAIPTRDPETQAKWAGLLKHLDSHHDTIFGINARVLAGGRIAAGERASVQTAA